MPRNRSEDSFLSNQMPLLADSGPGSCCCLTLGWSWIGGRWGPRGVGRVAVPQRDGSTQSPSPLHLHPSRSLFPSDRCAAWPDASSPVRPLFPMPLPMPRPMPLRIQGPCRGQCPVPLSSSPSDTRVRWGPERKLEDACEGEETFYFPPPPPSAETRTPGQLHPPPTQYLSRCTHTLDLHQPGSRTHTHTHTHTHTSYISWLQCMAVIRRTCSLPSRPLVGNSTASINTSPTPPILVVGASPWPPQPRLRRHVVCPPISGNPGHNSWS